MRQRRVRKTTRGGKRSRRKDPFGVGKCLAAQQSIRALDEIVRSPLRKDRQLVQVPRAHPFKVDGHVRAL